MSEIASMLCADFELNGCYMCLEMDTMNSFPLILSRKTDEVGVKTIGFNQL